MDLNNINLPFSLVVELYQNSLVNTEEIDTKSPPKDFEKSKESGQSNWSDRLYQSNGPKDSRHASEIESKSSVPGWTWLGGNQKNILIIVNYSDTLHLPERELKFLNGILAACKLEIDDVAIVNLNNHPGAAYKELSKAFSSRIIFLFDITPADFGLPMNFPHFQLQAFANNSFLYGPSLKELDEDKVLKSKLWVCLRRLFNI